MRSFLSGFASVASSRISRLISKNERPLENQNFPGSYALFFQSPPAPQPASLAFRQDQTPFVFTGNGVARLDAPSQSAALSHRLFLFIHAINAVHQHLLRGHPRLVPRRDQLLPPVLHSALWLYLFAKSIARNN